MFQISNYDFMKSSLNVITKWKKYIRNQFFQFQTMIFEILTKFHHKMIEYKRNQFCQFQKMIFEILTKFHNKMMKYKRNQFV